MWHDVDRRDESEGFGSMNIEIGKIYLVIPKNPHDDTTGFFTEKDVWIVADKAIVLETGDTIVSMISDTNKGCWVTVKDYDFAPYSCYNSITDTLKERLVMWNSTKARDVLGHQSKDAVMQDGLECVLALDKCNVDKFDQAMLLFGRDIVNQHEYLSIGTARVASELIKEIDLLEDCTDPMERKLRSISIQLLETMFRNLMGIDLDRLKVRVELGSVVK
jgi:hypothetical protein